MILACADAASAAVHAAREGDERAATIARALAERAPRSEVVLLETAQPHYPWLAQPGAAAEALLKFLRTV